MNYLVLCYKQEFRLNDKICNICGTKPRKSLLNIVINVVIN